MTNPELAPDMPELLPCPFCGSLARMHRLSGIGGFCAHCSDEDCFVGPELKGYHSEDEAVRQWNQRADLAPQAGSVDVEGPKLDPNLLPHRLLAFLWAECEEHFKIVRIGDSDHTMRLGWVIEQIANALNPGPQGSVDVKAVIDAVTSFYTRKEDRNFAAQVARNTLDNLLAGAPVGGDQELIDALLEAQRKINAAQEHIDELEQKHVMKNDKMFARGLTNDAYNCISHVLIELRKGAESPRPAIPGLQKAQGWQTVENVPRDQDVLVGYLNHAGEVEDVSVAYVSEGEKYHINSIYAEPRGDCRHCGGACKRVYVTHWMPLPAARDGRD